MSQDESSRRVYPTKDKHAAATKCKVVSPPTPLVDAGATDSNYSCFSQRFTPDQIDRGRRTLRRAETWRGDNAELFASFESWALGKAARNVAFAVQDWFETVRSKDRVDANGDSVGINNDFAAIFARWLIREHPQTARHVELRRSVFDVLMGGHDGR